MSKGVMAAIRHFLAYHAPSAPSMNGEQKAVAERLRRIKDRQKAIDIQTDVLQADKRDLRTHH